MSGKIKRELKMFLLAGFSAVATDMAIYYLLYGTFGHSLAKTLSFISGSLVAYLLNKYLTFEQETRSYPEMLRFAMLYLSTMGVNVAINKISLVVFPGVVLLAFLLATGSSTVLNYLGQKFWVFKSNTA